VFPGEHLQQGKEDKRDTQQEEATKEDDVVIPYHLWDSRLTRLWAGDELLNPHKYGMPQTAEVLRQRFCLRYWKIKVRTSFFQWFKKRFRFKTTRLRMVTRIPCEEGHKYVWTKKQTVRRYLQYHQSLWGGKDNERRTSLKAEEDCIH
jgi:hypothetical protein